MTCYGKALTFEGAVVTNKLISSSPPALSKVPLAKLPVARTVKKLFAF